MVTFIHGLSAHRATGRSSEPESEAHGREVLVAYDASPDADLALDWAAEVAALRHEPLRVLVAAEPLEGVISPQWPRSWSADVERRAHNLLQRHQAHPDAAACTVEHRVGDAVPTLVDASSSASLLVLGSRGHGMLQRILTGSVSQGTARRTHCPVVVVRPTAARDADRVVVGVDGSESSERALEFACQHALLTGHSVTILRAHRTPQPPPVDKHGDLPASLSSALLDEERALEVSVEDARSRHPGLDVRGDFIATAAGEALVEASRHADLVVIGARSRHPVVETVLGSVSREVLHHAHCSVGVVR